MKSRRNREAVSRSQNEIASVQGGASIVLGNVCHLKEHLQEQEHTPPAVFLQVKGS
jgi:hypothetical protein